VGVVEAVEVVVLELLGPERHVTPIQVLTVIKKAVVVVGVEPVAMVVAQ
jgi:hypothetical protein